MKTFSVNARKLALTLMNLKKTAYHHYGRKPSSLIKFIYYSCFRLNTFLVYENDLRQELPASEVGPDYEVVMPSLERLAMLRNSVELPREFYCDQTYGLKKCFLALNQETPAYLQWLIFKDDYSRFLIFPEDVVEFNYIVTTPEHRGRSLCTKMLKHTSIWLKNDGFRKAVAVIHAANIPSIRAFEKAGFKKTRQIKTLGPLNRRVNID